MDHATGFLLPTPSPTSRRTLVTAGAVIGLVVAVVGVAARADLLVVAFAASAAALVLLLGLRWPLLPLFAYAALIPLEDALRVAELGTATRLAAGLLVVTYGIPRIGRLTLRAMPLAGWLYAGWAVLSVGWAIRPDVSMRELPTLPLMFAVAVLVADIVVHRPAIVRPVLWAYSASAAVSALIGIVGYSQGAAFTAGRVIAFAEQDAAQFAAQLLPALVFSLYELLHGRWRLQSAFVATICTIAIVLSGTRGAWVSILVVLVAFILPRLRPAHRPVAIALILGAIAVTLVLLPSAAGFVERRTELAIETGGAGRTDIWSVGASVIASYPLAGAGFANFPFAFSAELARDTGLVVLAGPHSIVIGTLGELGSIGLILLVLFLAPLVVRRGWGPDADTVRAILASLLTAALFLDVLSNRKQVWLVIGLAAGLAYLARVRSGQRGSPVASLVPGAPPIGPRRIRRRTTLRPLPGPAPSEARRTG